MTRRAFLRASAAGSLLMASPGRPAPKPNTFDPPKVGEYQVYFGDLHNHSEVGYARGSLERAFEIAREHLDFFA
ncbi:MAG: twin-arginine translocation signal domain-containing protein, partial [Phycisphaerales bacterium]